MDTLLHTTWIITEEPQILTLMLLLQENSSKLEPQEEFFL